MVEKSPKVRIARPAGRPYQLRYYDPDEQREIRISVGCRDEDEAERQKKELEARLLLGIGHKSRSGRARGGPDMPWQEFRELNTELRLAGQRDKSAIDAESRLDIAERIIKPKTLGQMAKKEVLEDLQRKLLAGAESRYDPPRPRSKHTVKFYMNSVKAALRWAARQGWLPGVPEIEPVKTAKLRHAKGRPICAEEFDRMLQAVPKVVGEEAAPSWEYVLRGLWESGLRIGELMAMSWDDPNQIIPIWKRGALPVLFIPHDLQKNDTEESIPLLPGLESLLGETPVGQRTGWVFNPSSLQSKVGRRVRKTRPSPDWVGRIICRIGKKAGIIVQPANPRRSTPAKFASAHDLRRSCAERLREAGVPWEEVQAVMRHADLETTRRYYAPGNVQKSAAILRECLRKTTQPTPAGEGESAEAYLGTADAEI